MTTSSHPTSTTADIPADIADPWAVRTLLDMLNAGGQRCRAYAAEWTRWAAELSALRARMPGTPALLDADGCDTTAITRATHLDPAALHRDLALPVAAADHLAAVYTRHATYLADALTDAVADADPPPEPISAAAAAMQHHTSGVAW